MPATTVQVTPGNGQNSYSYKNYKKPGAAPLHTKKLTKSLKRKREANELTALQEQVQCYDTDSATEAFADLPLSRQTADALDSAHFKTLTDIQRRAIPLALKGRDILGAAKTGSGKTLAFLVPVLEALFRRQWTALDGVGALVVSPTRELATQIFEVLRRVGSGHAFSAGLVIGGKDLRAEQEALHRMNIVVCTPGRMLQHMDQTFGLNFANLALLVLDEADRILDLGFRRDIDAIVANLPRARQTLLFSATQTQSIRDLARLSLHDPVYVAVHEAAVSATPAQLQQFYMAVSLPEKLDTLFGFLRNHLASKTIVFVSSCKQVRFVYETFRQLHVGLPLLHLHGKQKQSARADVAARFAAAMHSCLFATDVVARGLDFPAVDWVVQLDAPEDAQMYIHRVGRTARFEKTGHALLFLCPSEEPGMTKRLADKNVPIVRVHAKQSKKTDIKKQLQGLCFKDAELKYLGQKAFVSYARSIALQKDRETFELAKYPFEQYAAALGLPGAPRLKGIRRVDVEKVKEKKNLPHGLRRLEQDAADSDDDDDDDDDAAALDKKKKKPKDKEVRTKYDRMVERQNNNVLTPHYSKLIANSAAASNAGSEDGYHDGYNDADFFQVKRRGYASSSGSSSYDAKRQPKPANLPGGATLTIDSNRRQKLLTSKKGLAKRSGRGQKLVFDDEGEAHAIYELQNEVGFRAAGPADDQRRRFLEDEQKRKDQEDEEDKEVQKEKKRVKKEKRKAKEREVAAVQRGMDAQVFSNNVSALDLSSIGEEEGGVEMVEVLIQESSRRMNRRTVDVAERDVAKTLDDLEKMAAGLLES